MNLFRSHYAGLFGDHPSTRSGSAVRSSRTYGNTFSHIHPTNKGPLLFHVYPLRPLPTADLQSHVPWPVFPRRKGWISVFRNSPSRLVQIFGGSR